MVGEELLSTPAIYQEEKKSPFKKILGINFIIFIIYYVLALLSLKLGRQGGSFGNLYASSFLLLYPLQVVVNFIAGIIFVFKKNSEKSSAFFLTAFIILIVGFGSCFLAVTGVF